MGYFTIAGIIGSFKVVVEKGWLYLIPFWLAVFVLSKIADWLIKKSVNNKAVQIRFISKYPHYNMGDILWMLQNTNQNHLLDDIISSASESFGKQIDIQIGKLSAIKISTANFSKEVLDKAMDQQYELQEEWSSKTGQKYPDLGMPKR